MQNIKLNKIQVLCILKWCTDRWGKSLFADSLPKITVYKSNGNTRKIKGEYDNIKNRIVIYLGAIESYEELCEIIIHEYTHYMLNSDEYDKIYYDLQDMGMKEKYIYKVHPHEIKCRENGAKYSLICCEETKNGSN